MKINSDELIKMLDFAIYQEETDYSPDMSDKEHERYIEGLHNARDLVRAFVEKKKLLG